MSVPISTAKVQYTLSATVQALPINFYFIDNTHIKAIRARSGVADYVMVIGTDYSLVGAGDEAGGTLTTIATNMVVGDKITIKRDIPITQLTNYVYNDKFPAEVHERALDKLTMVTQQLKEVTDRAVQFPESEVAGTGNIMPPASGRAAKILGFDASGNAVQLYDPVSAVFSEGDAIYANSVAALKAVTVAALTNGQQAHVAGYATPGDGGGGVFTYLSASASTEDFGTVVAPNAGSGRWLRVFSGMVNAKWFGAVGDGVVDDTVAAQRAIDSGAKLVYFPRGTYKQTAALTIPASVKVIGDGFAATIFTQATAATNNFNIYNVSNAAIEGVGINATSAVAIHVKAATTGVENIVLRNIYVFSLGTAGIGVYLESSTSFTILFTTIENVSVQGGGAASWGTKIGYKIGTATKVSVIGTRIIGGRLWRNHVGLDLTKCDTVMAYGLALDDCDQHGIYFQAAGGCYFYGTRFETATFGKVVEFTASAADNYVDGLPGNATTLLVPDAGVRNSYEGLDGSGGLLNRFGDGPYDFRAAVTFQSTLNEMTIRKGAASVVRPSNPASVAVVPSWAMGGTRSGTGPGGSTTIHDFLFPFEFLACYLVTGIVRNFTNTDRAIRVSYVFEYDTGLFAEVNINYTQTGAGVCTFSFARTGDNVNFSLAAACGGGITCSVSRNMIKLH